VPPEPPPGLLQRILESRAAGVRVALPRVGRDFRRWLVGALAAAAVLALVMNTRSANPPPASTENDYQDIARVLSLWPPDAMAQEAGRAPPPRYEPVRGLRVGNASGGTWIYQDSSAFDDGTAKYRGRLRVVVRTAEWDRQPAWLVSQQQLRVRDSNSGTTDWIRGAADTMYADLETLRPIRYATVGAQFRLIHRFVWDTVYEALDIGGAHPRSWRVHAEIPGPVDAPLVLRWRWFDVALLLQALPLGRGWRGSVYTVGLVGRDPARAAIVPLDLRVEGGERIEVPAGTFDCWKIVARDGREHVLTFWASKDRGWLVKEQQRGPDWRMERTLVSATPPVL
ncbi:MAG TPA: hypothetical protein VEU74_12450, partial [Gemmatimonadales bacterium]|nr:hypothetical protein [Gemmatimonadales bacterium]